MSHGDKNLAGSGSYVLNAMDDKEREEFEAQLLGSEDLRNEVTELTDTAVLLGLAVTPITPSPALKQNIMARLSQTPQLPKVDAPDEFVTVRKLHAVPALASEESRPELPATVVAMTPAASKAQARWYSRPVFAIAAAAAVVAIIVGGVVTSNVMTQNASTSQVAARNTAALATITTASDVRRVTIPVKTGGSATLVWSAKLAKSVLIGKNLTVLPTDKTYELWYINAGGQATPAGLFETDGTSSVEALTGVMGNGDTIGLTVEPAGGSSQPTTTPVVAIQTA